MAEPELHHSLCNFVLAQIGTSSGTFGDCVSMGVFDGHELAGVAVFHNWEPTAGVIEISIASRSRRWLSRRVLAEMFGYCFDTAGCQLVVGRVSAKNLRSRRINKAYGFEEYIIPRLRGRHEDEALMILTEEKWRASRFHSQPREGCSIGKE